MYSLPVSDSEPSSTIVRLASSGRASSPVCGTALFMHVYIHVHVYCRTTVLRLVK